MSPKLLYVLIKEAFARKMSVWGGPDGTFNDHPLHPGENLKKYLPKKPGIGVPEGLVIPALLGAAGIGGLGYMMGRSRDEDRRRSY